MQKRTKGATVSKRQGEGKEEVEERIRWEGKEKKKTLLSCSRLESGLDMEGR